MNIIKNWARVGAGCFGGRFRLPVRPSDLAICDLAMPDAGSGGGCGAVFSRSAVPGINDFFSFLRACAHELSGPAR